MDKIRALWKLKDRSKKVKICRVSDLIKKGFDTDKLADDFVKLNQEVWGDITDSRYLWTKEMVLRHFTTCPHLVYCAFENELLVASLTNITTTEAEMRTNKSWLEKTGNGFLTTHQPTGDIGFGVDLTVSKRASKRVSDKLVLSAILISVIGGGLKAVYLGARIPGYHKNSHLTVEEYVFGKRQNGKPLDPELHFYLKEGFEIVEIIPEYMEDPKSLNYGAVIKWKNPFYWITRKLPFLKTIILLSAKLVIDEISNSC